MRVDRSKFDMFRNARAEVRDVYRFSNSGGSMGWHRALVAVFYSEEIGYFCVQQEFTCDGDAYSCLRLPAGIENPKAQDYVNSALYEGWVLNEWFAPWMEDDLRGIRYMNV